MSKYEEKKYLMEKVMNGDFGEVSDNDMYYLNMYYQVYFNIEKSTLIPPYDINKARLWTEDCNHLMHKYIPHRKDLRFP